MDKECKALKLEKEAMHRGMWESLKAEKKGGKGVFPRASRKECSPVYTY